MTDARPLMISCTGKETYRSKAAAIVAKATRLDRAKSRMTCHKQKKRAVSQLEPYRCDRCHHWHLGTRQTGRRMI